MNYFDRPKQEVRVSGKRILIVSDTQKTEYNYFSWIKKSCRLYSVEIRKNKSTLGIKKALDIALEKKTKAEKDSLPYDAIWLVIDKDDNPDGIFNSLIKAAEKERVQVAYSNRSFEYWFLLHFENITKHLGQKELEKKLTQHLRYTYSKKDNKILALLTPEKEADAIKNAKSGIKEHESCDNTRPSQQDSSTTVYKLVEYLRNLS